jgi:hypothetical protein
VESPSSVDFSLPSLSFVLHGYTKKNLAQGHAVIRYFW